MLFALSFALSHDIIPHSHEEEHSQGMNSEHEPPHFELSDIFSRFSHMGNNLTFALLTKQLKNNLYLNTAGVFNYINIKYLPDTKPIHLCIRDNPDLISAETIQVYSLRAPPFLSA